MSVLTNYLYGHINKSVPKFIGLFTLFLLIHTQYCRGQKSSGKNDDNVVSITVVGQGKTIDEARANALRSAVEQAFGAFISSNTKIINDSIVKDEFSSISAGNILGYEELHQSQLSDLSFVLTLKTTV